MRDVGYEHLTGHDKKQRIRHAQVSCDREKRPGPGCEPDAAKREDRHCTPEELKSVDRTVIAQRGIAALKDAEHLEIDEPEKFRAWNILKGTRRQFST
ncbi:hypothetical protein [Bradyrhizobium sp. OAE829]|uniref:hypothetical protein n=1 Tax=Bradyrhizobium sp. OAE829 TaxID=2663807 RepID=UPI0017897652